MNDKAVEKDAAGKGLENSGNQLKQGGLAAGVGAEDGDDFAWPGVKARGFQGEERSLRRICRVGVADLLDGKANFCTQASGFRRSTRRGGAAAGAHAGLRRKR